MSDAGLERDARRYRRLRVLGCALMDTPQLDNGTVVRFTGLDELVDADLKFAPSRGEAALTQSPLPREGEWVAVPREPTEAMLKAFDAKAYLDEGAIAAGSYELRQRVITARLKIGWAALLAAAPPHDGRVELEADDE